MSRVLLAPGVRTTTRRDWRAGAAVALSTVAGDPTLWLLGTMGFAARGGTILLILPMLTIPSPVVLSVLFRGEVGALAPGDVGLVAVTVGLALSFVAIGGVILSAYADVATAERVVRDPETLELRLGRAPRPLDRDQRRSLLSWVAAVQAAALLPIILCVTMLVDRLARLATAELLSPSGTDVPLGWRVLPGAAMEIMLTVLVVVLVEACASLASRRLMASAWGVLPHGPATGGERRVAVAALRRLVRQPGRVLATAAAGWLLMALVVGVVLIGSGVAWSTVRDVLVVGGATDDPGVLLVAGLIVALFCAMWLAGLALVGFASAVRSSLWTVDALR